MKYDKHGYEHNSSTTIPIYHWPFYHHIVKQREYPIYDGIHDAIVTEEIWQAAQEKRKINGFKHEKKYSLDHANILSGILKYPNCGAPI